MQATDKSTDRLMVDFYLPCAISGLLLAGLIALTTPAPNTDISHENAPIVALR